MTLFFAGWDVNTSIRFYVNKYEIQHLAPNVGILVTDAKTVMAKKNTKKKKKQKTQKRKKRKNTKKKKTKKRKTKKNYFFLFFENMIIN